MQSLVNEFAAPYPANWFDKMHVACHVTTETGFALDSRDYAGNYKMEVAHGLWEEQARLGLDLKKGAQQGVERKQGQFKTSYLVSGKGGLCGRGVTAYHAPRLKKIVLEEMRRFLWALGIFDKALDPSLVYASDDWPAFYARLGAEATAALRAGDLVHLDDDDDEDDDDDVTPDVDAPDPEIEQDTGTDTGGILPEGHPASELDPDREDDL